MLPISIGSSSFSGKKGLSRGKGTHGVSAPIMKLGEKSCLRLLCGWQKAAGKAPCAVVSFPA